MYLLDGLEVLKCPWICRAIIDYHEMKRTSVSLGDQYAIYRLLEVVGIRIEDRHKYDDFRQICWLRMLCSEPSRIVMSGDEVANVNCIEDLLSIVRQV